MTQEQKRIKIAEACGWAVHDTSTLFGRHAYGCHSATIPDYFNDLNACHEMEKVLKDHEIEQYNDLLGSFLWSGYPASRRNFHATATQRTEAFGKTLNLW